MRFQLIILLLLSFVYAKAAEVSIANWASGTTPVAGDNVNGATLGSNYTISLSGNVTFNNLSLNGWSTATSVTFNSSNGNPYTLNINLFDIQGPYTMIVDDHITLNVTGAATSNGGTITVLSGGNIRFYEDVTFSGAGTVFNVNSGGNVVMDKTLQLTSGPNDFNISGNLTMNALSAINGAQTLSISNSGVVKVITNATFDNSATFDVNNTGSFRVGGNLNVGGGSSGVVNSGASLYVGGAVNLSGGGAVGGAGYNPANVGIGSSEALPVKLNSVNACQKNGGVYITWQTVSEINNHFFTIERSLDGISFIPLADIDGAGNSNQLLNYAYTDNFNGFGLIYYRLKQTDFDGAYSYSKNIVIKLQYQLPVKISGNQIEFEMPVNENPVIVTISNILGNAVYRSTFQNGYSKNIKFLVNEPPGVYFLSIMQNDVLIHQAKFYLNN